jgi:carboxylesterase
MINPHLDRSPFYFNRGQGPVGVLLIHGWTGSPPEMRPLGEYLAAQGLVVHGVRLPGHGTTPEDLLHTTWQDWTEQAHAALDALYAECSTVFVGGLSMGGSLTLHLGATYPRPIAGLIPMGAPIFVHDRRLALARVARYVLPWNTKSDERDFQDPEAHNLVADYRRFPTVSVIQLTALMRDTRRRLGQVRAPILIMQGLRDQTVVPRSAQYIFDHVASADKTLVYLAESGHCIPIDKERRAVGERTAAWIAAHAPVPVTSGQ